MSKRCGWGKEFHHDLLWTLMLSDIALTRMSQISMKTQFTKRTILRLVESTDIKRELHEF